MDEDNLEPDPGGPLKIEQPTVIATKPLSSKDQDDRALHDASVRYTAVWQRVGLSAEITQDRATRPG